jgi:hypothetical protein
MEKQLMKVDNNGTQITLHRELTPAVWQMLERIGSAAFKAHIYQGISSPEAAAMIMLKGYELGLGVSASFEFVKQIQGKFELIPRGALALIMDHPAIKSVEVNRLEEKGAYVGHECTIVRQNGFTYTARFSMVDAQKAGLVKPDSGYAKYPENMCMWRSVGFACDVAAADITAGMTTLLKMPEAYGVDLDQQGNVIESTWTDATPVPATEQPKDEWKPEVTVTLEQLVNTYGADAILTANGGKLPMTDDELQAIAKTLGAS